MGEKAMVRGRGRPAVHLDGAARQEAYRERQAGELAKGKALIAITDAPTRAFVRLMVGRLLTQAADPEAERQALADYVAGIAAGPTT